MTTAGGGVKRQISQANEEQESRSTVTCAPYGGCRLTAITGDMAISRQVEDSLPLELAMALAFHQVWYLLWINVKRLTALVPDVRCTSTISDRRLLVVFRGIPIELDDGMFGGQSYCRGTMHDGRSINKVLTQRLSMPIAKPRHNRLALFQSQESHRVHVSPHSTFNQRQRGAVPRNIRVIPD